MTRAEIIQVIKDLVNESDDTELDPMLITAVNFSYTSDLSKLDKRVSTARVPVIQGIATLPEECMKIISVTPSDKNDKRVGNAYITNQTGMLSIVYTYVRDKLLSDTDEPDLSPELEYALVLYGAMTYYDYRKKTQQSQWFKQQYETVKFSYINDTDDTEEYVLDAYETGGEE